MTNKKYREFIYKATPFWSVSLFLLIFSLMFVELNLNEFDPKTVSDLLDYRWRLFWGLSVVLLTVSLTWSYVNSVLIIQRYMNASAYINKTTVTLILLIISIVIAKLDFGGTAAGSLLNLIFDKTNVDVKFITGLLNCYAAIAIIALIISNTAISIKEDSGESEISEKTTQIYRSFQSSSVVLATGILEIYCLFSWAGSLGEPHSVMAQKGKYLILASGLLFTGMLCVFYIPTFLKRNHSLLKLVTNKQFSTKDELDNWYAVNHLEKYSGNNLSDIAAFLLPIATGVLVNILHKAL